MNQREADRLIANIERGAYYHKKGIAVGLENVKQKIMRGYGEE